MADPKAALPFPAGQPGESLKNVLKLLQGMSAAAPGPAAGQPVQIGAELAYKLAQASAQASDPELLKDSVVSLLDALEGINKSFAKKEECL